MRDLDEKRMGGRDREYGPVAVSPNAWKLSELIMYGLPSDFDLTRLTGLDLEMVCYAQYSVYLHLSRRTLISVESSMALDDGPQVDVSQHPDAVLALLGQQTINASESPEGGLKLTFANGAVLDIQELLEYESYSIEIDGVRTIV